MDPDPELDYRFGWRWLLPVTAGDKVLLLGFSDGELIFWRRILAEASITTDPGAATVLLLKDLSPDHRIVQACPRLDVLCAIGPGSMVAAWRRRLAGRFARISDFALLPADRPRVVVPLGESGPLVQGLGLHRPGRRTARLALAIGTLLARFGVDRPLRTRTLCILIRVADERRQAGLWQAGRHLCNGDAGGRYALYLGTPDAHRKTVVLPVGGRPECILKIGESIKAREALHNEMTALQTMSRTSLAPSVPRILGADIGDGFIALSQEYRARKAAMQSAIRTKAVEFLIALARIDAGQRPAGEILAPYRHRLDDPVDGIDQQKYAARRKFLDGAVDSDVMIAGSRSHGDFAPWNCALTDQGFFVYDWEDSCDWDVALGDAFFFATAAAAYVQRRPDLERVENAAFSLARNVAEGTGLERDKIRFYWNLWLLRMVAKKDAPLYRQLLENAMN
ncbi:hypothetical protein JT06_05275 [Desulfobulbus sp. Tol-SR]|jgi:hypothetical protein|nr:hypothetical protein JT06_05275 [Desulfobulbus sp. Tol-SR]